MDSTAARLGLLTMTAKNFVASLSAFKGPMQQESFALP